MQGASPLASPRLSLRGTGSLCRCGKLNGGLPSALPTRRMSAAPGGAQEAVARRPCRCGVRRGLARFGRPPTLPLACFSVPLSAPPPSGKGASGYFYARGFALASPGLNPRLAAKPTGSGSLRGCRRGSTAGEPACRDSKCRKRSKGARGRSPRQNQFSPFPGGEGGRGMGAEKLKARSAGDCPPAPPCRHHSGRDSKCRREHPPSPRKTIQTI